MTDKVIFPLLPMQKVYIPDVHKLETSRVSVGSWNAWSTLELEWQKWSHVSRWKLSASNGQLNAKHNLLVQAIMYTLILMHIHIRITSQKLFAFDLICNCTETTWNNISIIDHDWNNLCVLTSLDPSTTSWALDQVLLADFVGPGLLRASNA